MVGDDTAECRARTMRSGVFQELFCQIMVLSSVRAKLVVSGGQDCHIRKRSRAVHFSNFLINYLIKIIYLFPSKHLKKEKQSYTLFKKMILQNNAYYVSHIF